MEEIILEKVKFIEDNKNLLIDNISTVKFDLFKILNKNDSLEEMEEYKNIMDNLQNKDTKNNYELRDSTYIIYMLAAFLDKISMNQIEKEFYKKNLFRYIDCLTMEREKQVVKTREKQINLSA